MKRNICLIIVILLAGAAVTGCTGVNKLLKGKDNELMYKKALEFYHNGKFENARKLFEEVAPYYAGKPQEDSVMYYMGSSCYKRSDYMASEVIFDRFRRYYGRSPFIESVEYMYAMGFYYGSPDANRDQTATIKAINAISDYLQRYPESINKPLCLVRIDEMKNKLYDKVFINASTYYKIGRYKSAVLALRNAIGEYPETPHREEILYLTTKSCYELAFHSVSSLQRERYLDMMDSYYTFIAEFPNSEHRREMDRMQASARKYLDENQPEAIEAGEEPANLPNPEVLQQI